MRSIDILLFASHNNVWLDSSITNAPTITWKIIQYSIPRAHYHNNFYREPTITIIFVIIGCSCYVVFCPHQILTFRTCPYPFSSAPTTQQEVPPAASMSHAIAKGLTSHYHLTIRFPICPCACT